MKALILAGGLGTRLRPLIGEIPKPMAEVAGRPFLEHLILFLKKNGLTDIVLSVGYTKDLIINHFSNGRPFGVNIEYVIEAEPLGTGGAVKFAMKNQDLGDEFFVLNGDCYFVLDHREMLKAHKGFDGIGTIALSPQIQTERFGSVEIDNNLRICKFREKAKTNRSGLINGGVYIFSRDILRHFPSKHSFSLEYDVFPNAIMDGFYGFVSKEYFIDIGVPDDFRRAQHDFPLYE